jgi:hypothetical protein
MNALSLATDMLTPYRSATSNAVDVDKPDRLVAAAGCPLLNQTNGKRSPCTLVVNTYVRAGAPSRTSCALAPI